MTPEQWLQQQEGNLVECTRYGGYAKHNISVCLARKKKLENDKGGLTYIGKGKTEHTFWRCVDCEDYKKPRKVKNMENMEDEKAQEEVKVCIDCGAVVAKLAAHGKCKGCYNAWYKLKKDKDTGRKSPPMKEEGELFAGPSINIDFSEFMTEDKADVILDKLEAAARNNFRTVEAQALAMIVEALAE